jgi:hypothetical protein
MPPKWFLRHDWRKYGHHHIPYYEPSIFEIIIFNQIPYLVCLIYFLLLPRSCIFHCHVTLSSGVIISCTMLLYITKMNFFTGKKKVGVKNLVSLDPCRIRGSGEDLETLPPPPPPLLWGHLQCFNIREQISWIFLILTQLCFNEYKQE